MAIEKSVQFISQSFVLKLAGISGFSLRLGSQIILAVVSRFCLRAVAVISSLIVLLGLCDVNLALARAPAAQGREQKFRDTVLDLRDGDRLVVVGWKGKISIDGRSAQNTIRAAKFSSDRNSNLFESLAFAIRRDEQNLIIEWKGPSTAAEFEPWLKNSPELNLEIGIASRIAALEVQLRDGAIQLQGVRSPATVFGNDINLNISQQEGRVLVRGSKVEALLQSLKGGLNFESLTGKLSVSQTEGDLQIVTYSSEVAIAQSQGGISLRAHDGAVKLNKTTGWLDLDLVRANFSCMSHEGAVRGRIEDGSVNIDLDASADVILQSAKANIGIKVPETSGAMVRVSSEMGQVTAPEAVRLVPGGSAIRQYNGRLSGTQTKGSITINSKDGNVRIR
jgi:hypothetical protein